MHKIRPRPAARTRPLSLRAKRQRQAPRPGEAWESFRLLATDQPNLLTHYMSWTGCESTETRNVHRLQEDWGELNTGKKVPQLFVLEAESGEVTTVAGLPEETSVGQPVWTPDASGALSAGDLMPSNQDLLKPA